MKKYTSNLTQKEYNHIIQFIPAKTVSLCKYSFKAILNGIFYSVKIACTWRDIPGDLPDWRVCYYHFRELTKLGVWERAKIETNKIVRTKKVKRNSLPSCILIDSQSVKNVDTGCKSGIDGNKKVKGIKKHMLCDTLGLNWDRYVTPANIGDREGALRLSISAREKNLLKLCSCTKMDQGYTGGDFIREFETNSSTRVEVVNKLPNQVGFQVLPMRWVIERSNSWMMRRT